MTMYNFYNMGVLPELRLSLGIMAPLNSIFLHLGQALECCFKVPSVRIEGET